MEKIKCKYCGDNATIELRITPNIFMCSDSNCHSKYVKEKFKPIGFNYFRLNERVRFRDSFRRFYWISEIQDTRILIRTTEYEQDPDYDDYWVYASDIVSV